MAKNVAQTKTTAAQTTVASYTPDEAEALVAATSPQAKATGRPAAHATSARITVLVDGNPKKKGTASAERFEGYRQHPDQDTTVAEYIAHVIACGGTKAKARADLRWDAERGFIAIA